MRDDVVTPGDVISLHDATGLHDFIGLYTAISRCVKSCVHIILRKQHLWNMWKLQRGHLSSRPCQKQGPITAKPIS
jgi:hypothetical protein